MQRAQTGEKIDKTAWDQDKAMMTVMELVEWFDLSWNREVIIPTDNAMLDRLFEAAVCSVDSHWLIKKYPLVVSFDLVFFIRRGVRKVNDN
jgi:hypothetical protein